MTEAEKTLEVQKEEAALDEGTEWTRDRRTFVPRADIYETEEQIVVVVDTPGAVEDQIDVTLEKDLLTINALIEPEEYEGYSLSYAEYEVGDYKRSFKISSEINRNQIEASYKDGVLRLYLPKSEEVKAKKISIKKG